MNEKKPTIHPRTVADARAEELSDLAWQNLGIEDVDVSDPHVGAGHEAIEAFLQDAKDSNLIERPHEPTPPVNRPQA